MGRCSIWTGGPTTNGPLLRSSFRATYFRHLCSATNLWIGYQANLYEVLPVGVLWPRQGSHMMFNFNADPVQSHPFVRPVLVPVVLRFLCTVGVQDFTALTSGSTLRPSTACMH